MNGLFRAEVVAAERRGSRGAVSVAQPPGIRALAALAILAVILAFAFLTGAEYTRRSRVAGQLVPDEGLATLAAPEAGTITRTFAAEGDTVRRGEPLVVITISRSTPSGGDTTAGLLSSIDERRTAMRSRFATGRRLLQVQAQGAMAQLAAAGRELDQVEASLVLGRERLRIAEQLRAELRELVERQFASRLELAKQEQAVLELAAAQNALERLATSVERERLALEQRLRELEMERAAQRAAEDGERAALEEARLRITAGGELLVTAPLDGVLASTLAVPGQAVTPGQPLMNLVPSGSKLQARLLVPSRAVGFIAEGDAVLLRYPAFPHAKFGHHRGTVAAVSHNALDARAVSLLTGGARSAEPSYRVIVDLERQFVGAYGEHRPLRPGMLVEADILGERRKLYEWLLEPLYSLTGRL